MFFFCACQTLLISYHDIDTLRQKRNTEHFTHNNRLVTILPVEQTGMGPGEEGSSMGTSLGSTSKSTTNERDEDQEGHESKKLRLTGGLDASVDTEVCVYQDVDICGEMTATTTHENIEMTAEYHPDLKNAKTAMESTQQRKANLLPDKIVYGMKSGEILDPLKVERGRTQRAGIGERAYHV